MKSVYHSPLRTAQAEATREAIVQACIALLEAGEDLTYAAVSERAGVQERTVYRHFARKPDLEAAAWGWITGNLTQADLGARSLDELLPAVRRSFRGFEAGAALIKTMLRSPQGLEVRRGQQDRRRAMFEACLDAEVPGLPAATRAQAVAVLQLLYSAPAWEQLSDFFGMSGDEAADTVELAIRAFLAGLPAALERRDS